MRPKVVDLFCGAGGLTRGFAEEGFDVVAGIDVDDSAKHAYSANNDAEFICRDIRGVSTDLLAHLYTGATHCILAGCAPCQAFSTYTQGLHKDEDTRWELLGHFSRLVREFLPEIATMENVPQLRKHPRFEEFLKDLNNNGYMIWCDVVECASYGVPQTRKRLVLLASRLGPITMQTPTHEKGSLSVRGCIGHLPPIADGESLAADPTHRAARLTAINKKRLHVSKPGGTWKDWPAQLRARCHNPDVKMSYVSVYGRMEWDKLAPTITTEFHGIGHGRFGHPDQLRAISLREGALLQTFPPEYQFAREGAPTLISTSRLIGNAVPVNLARGIAGSIAVHLQEQVTN